MGFTGITIDKYIKLHLKNNPKENKTELKKNLKSSLNDYKNGVKCSCGNDIWVIGSAAVGNSCFTCITGESMPSGDYEIESAVVKMHSRKGAKHINDINPTQINGFFDDDDYEVNLDMVKKPGLCFSCQYENDPNEEFLCQMTRADQKDDKNFNCFSYTKVGDKL